MNTDAKTTIVRCPTCKKQVAWTPSQHYRPFCSERCKLIDLGDWASEGHKIPGQPVYAELPEQEDHPPDCDY